MRPFHVALGLAMALLCASCSDPSLALGDCQHALAAAKKQRDAGPTEADPSQCSSAAHAFQEQAQADDFPAALRRDRFAFSAYLANRCAGAGSEASIRDCITKESGRIQVQCAGAVTTACTGGDR